MGILSSSMVSSCVVIAAISQIGTTTEEIEKRAVKEAAAEFYGALNALFKGDTAPMEKVWSHADDVTYMGPGGGMQVGWDQVLANWKAQAAKKLGGEIKSTKRHVYVGGNIAVTNDIEFGENIIDGKAQKVSIRATNVFRKEDGKWKMISHHTDKLSFIED